MHPIPINFNTNSTAFNRDTAYVPFSLKYTSNTELDLSYNIATWFGWKNSLFLSVYAAVNGITTAPDFIAVKRKARKTLLWGFLFRFEPAVELTERCYLLGLWGFENWYAEKTWMVQEDTAKNVPIDYRDFAYGLGCDWQMFDRIGLHVRCKWMKHVDMEHEMNNWITPVASTELKMWF